MITKFKQWTFRPGLNVVSGTYSNELLDQILCVLYQDIDASSSTSDDLVLKMPGKPFGDCSPGNIDNSNFDEQFQDSEFDFYQKLGIRMRSEKLSKHHSVPQGIVNALLRWHIALVSNESSISNIKSLLSECQGQIIVFTKKFPKEIDKSRLIQFRKKISIKRKDNGCHC